MILSSESDEYDPILIPNIGAAHVYLGEIEEGIDWFERATEIPNPFYSLSVMFLHDNGAVWNHPRYQALLAKISLDDASIATAKAALAER